MNDYVCEPPVSITHSYLSLFKQVDAPPSSGNGVDVLHFHHITAVGCTLDPDGADDYWFSRAGLLCKKSGITFADDLQLTPWDLNNGHDILNENFPARQTDLLLFCYVYNPQKGMPQYVYKPSGSHTHKAEYDSHQLISSQHHSKRSWRQIPERFNPKIIMSVANAHRCPMTHRETEITIREVLNKRYVKGPVLSFGDSYLFNNFKLESLFRRDIAETVVERGECDDTISSILKRALNNARPRP